jgi:hypothetical protein
MNKRQKRKEIKKYHLVEKIRNAKVDNISLSWNSNQLPGEETPDKAFATILYVPEMSEADHYHISLSDKQALKLRNWLNTFLELKGIE